MAQLGKKWTMILLGFPFTAGFLLLLLAENLAMLYTGRLLYGFSSGAFGLLAPAYTSETVEPSIRGALGSLQQLIVTLGVLFMTVLGKVANTMYCGLHLMLAGDGVEDDDWHLPVHPSGDGVLDVLDAGLPGLSGLPRPLVRGQGRANILARSAVRRGAGGGEHRAERGGQQGGRQRRVRHTAHKVRWASRYQYQIHIRGTE